MSCHFTAASHWIPAFAGMTRLVASGLADLARWIQIRRDLARNRFHQCALMFSPETAGCGVPLGGNAGKRAIVRGTSILV
jgi:hypothetical protein